METITMRAGVAVAARYASPALALAAATRDESSAAPTADGDVGFVRPLHSLHVRLSLLLRPRAVVLVSRFDARAGLVILRQRFVRRCQICAQQLASRRIALLPDGAGRRGPPNNGKPPPSAHARLASIPVKVGEAAPA